MAIWKRLHAFRPSLVGGCRPIQLAARFASPEWEIVHQHKKASFAIPCEIVVARKRGD
jgi:hypothetical protein